MLSHHVLGHLLYLQSASGGDDGEEEDDDQWRVAVAVAGVVAGVEVVGVVGVNTGRTRTNCR